MLAPVVVAGGSCSRGVLSSSLSQQLKVSVARKIKIKFLIVVRFIVNEKKKKMKFASFFVIK